MLGAPGFGDQRGSGTPFAAHAEAEKKTEDGELRNRMSEAAGGARKRVEKDRGHQRTSASDAVGDDAENQAAEGGRDQSEGVEEAGRAGAHREFADQIGEDERVEHDVHGVEHPAEA